MIRIAITQAAFDAITATLPLGSVGYENEVNERGERYVWLAPNVVDRLRAQRRPWRELQRRDPAAGQRGEGRDRRIASEKPAAAKTAQT
jgi:hypothetical protein